MGPLVAERGSNDSKFSSRDRDMMRQKIGPTRPFTPADMSVPYFNRSAVANTSRYTIESQAVEKLFSQRLGDARDIFVAGERSKEKEMKAYDLDQDALVYNVLAEQKHKPAYAEAKKALDAYTKMQLETHIGERLHVGISKFVYRNADGELRTESTDESALNMIKRGRDYRRTHGKSVDWDREDAEVTGFSRIQEIMTDESTPVGAMMLFVSPPGDKEKGTIYKLNFYEIQQKMADGTVIAHRFTSGLAPKESQQRLAEIDDRYQRTGIPTDAEFIANPVYIAPGSFGITSAEDVHTFMHKDHQHMTKKDFTIVRQACQPIINQYLDALTEHPDDMVQQNKLFRALLNYADQVADELADTHQGQVFAFKHESMDKQVRPWLPPHIDIDALAEKEVKFKETGCGASGDNKSAASVMEFGKSDEAKNSCGVCGKNNYDNHYHCPGCTKKYADETDVGEDARTKSCNCGFEFGC